MNIRRSNVGEIDNELTGKFTKKYKGETENNEKGARAATMPVGDRNDMGFKAGLFVREKEGGRCENSNDEPRRLFHSQAQWAQRCANARHS